MGKIIIPASITIENGVSIQRYRWKSKDKVSIYKRKCKRAFVRITNSNFVKKLSVKNRKYKQVNIKFVKSNQQWLLILNRINNKSSTLQTYFGSHPYLQLVLNSHLPNELWKKHELSSKKTCTFPINVKFNLNEWKDVKLKPSDFLIEVEKLPKSLMNISLEQGFKVDFVPKGRNYDLELIGPNGNKFMLAISSHTAKNKSRSKEKIKQKILMDIAKLLPLLYQQNRIIPIIICSLLEFDGSWSYTTNDYLDFYKSRFNFKILTTNFKKGWEKEICSTLLELDRNNKVFK